FEALGRIGANTDISRSKIQIFATDVSETAIQKARTGVYRTSEMESVSEQRLNTFFTKADGNYRVIKPVRDTIVFAVHNFLKDPPFSKVDLISCRNVFIYFDAFLQKKALTTFHYALKKNGFLLMGNSETPGKSTDLFASYSKKGKIFSRKSGTGHFSQSISQQKKPKKSATKEKNTVPSAHRTDFRKSAESVLIRKYCPTSVIVDEHMAVVDFNGNLAPFLELPHGKPSHELLKMARKELAFELRNAVHKVKASQETLVKEGIPVKYNDEEFSVRIEIIPLTEIVAPHYLILFQKTSPKSSLLEKFGRRLKSTFSSTKKGHLQQRNSALEKELEQVREDVRAITEEQEAYNEELQSANEELLSSNEEMQSLNEELETSKEEVQSTNEELIIVNRELIEKQDELSDSLDFLDAIIATMHEPFLVLEKDFRIQKVNASFTKMFGIDKAKVEGELLFKIQEQKWNNERLRTLLQEILPENQHFVDEEITIDVSKGNQQIYVINAQEIIRKKGNKELILLALADITHRKKVENDLHNSVATLNKTNDQLDRYVHLASHDLQEPLRKIMIFADRLMGKGNITDPADIVMMGKIETAAQRMSGLVRGLLEYSTVAHHGALFETTDLNQLLLDIISDFELLIEEKEAKISIDELPNVHVIPLQIGQLLNNLIGNALKFNKEGVSPEISITSKAFPSEKLHDFPTLLFDRTYVELIIADNGIGFNPKYKEQIFMIFQRLRQSRNLQGSGIGLSLVKKIVENHNGAIFTVSEEGQGAEFHVILPMGEM
ncbi:hypothetical protein LCGC14_1618190, partial [marine sediment metagenome]